MVAQGFSVDLNKPLVFQVGHLGEDYQEWVHQPIASKEGPRFFESNFWESLTKNKWWYIPLVWLPVVCWSISKSVRMGRNFPFIGLIVCCGIFIWTLMEYTLHRFLFHIKTKSYWGNTLHYLLHGCHHKHPMDGLRLVFPPAATAVLCFPFWNLLKLVSTPSTTPALFGGGLLGYVMYDVTHYYLHHAQPTSEVPRNLKKYHLNHHFRIQNRGFGITSSFWDKVFGTLPQSKAAAKKSVAEYPFAKPGCQERCGNISIPYPFGIGSNCSIADGFAVTCNHSFNPPKPFINSINLEVLNISLNGSTVQVNNPVITYNCSSRANGKDVDLRETPFTFSDTYNRFTASGCDNLALVFRNSTVVITGCMSICNPYIRANSQSQTGCYGINCCQTEIPPSLGFFNASLESINQDNIEDGCKYAFMVDYQWFRDKNIFVVREMEYVPAVLDWACNTSGSFCGANARCLYNNASSSRRSECFCSKGYEGSPYLPSGCRDIDECSDPSRNHCGRFCLNTPGSYNCSCPDGYLSADDLHANGIFSSLGALLLLICMWWLYREVNRRKEAKLKEKFFKRNGGLLLQQQLSSDQGNLETTKLFTSKELEKATDNYNANRILGQGGQGTVYKGMLIDGRIVAIKKSKALDEGKHEPFINEVVILSRINIRNVVKLFGCCLETEVPMLVYEFIPNGTLSQCLHDQNEEFPLTWDLRLRIATEIAGALFYLHSLASIAIYHRDIKSANILLDEKFRAKVSDFGISRSISVDNTHLTTAVQGTFGYLDPEYFQSSQFTEKSDVYSFGVVLVELLTGKKPILSGKSNEGGSLTAYFLLTMKENRLYDILDARVVKEGGEKEILAVANIAKRCLYLNGSSRPTMKEVVMELDGIRMSNGATSRPTMKEVVMGLDGIRMSNGATSRPTMKEVVMELDGIRMSNGATATVKQSCDNVKYATEDDLTGPQEAASTSTGSSYRAMDIELPLLLDKSSSSL
ncbi:hypothetical protein RHGRI_005155 [Rhododendron griersonianum]|uniref:Protein kinase domain-containing protein n=1 Tax=Rhododendron griersonianum TaxID=479676 RepID=A0AAV6LB73_9ERIC|nr:hypothetical protein RHGRI_005155 [Rhododendron griersonianum]